METTMLPISGLSYPNFKTSKCGHDHTNPTEFKVPLPSILLKSIRDQGADEEINYCLADIGA